MGARYRIELSARSYTRWATLKRFTLTRLTLLTLFVVLVAAGCGGSDTTTETETNPPTAPADDPTVSSEAAPAAPPATPGAEEQQFPDVVAAEATRDSGNNVRFDVTVSSPYDSAERYADAWRVKGPDGTVYGVRELLHDHAGEQPFTRSLDGVEIPADVETVTIEARDLANGWGGTAVDVAIPPPGETAAEASGDSDKSPFALDPRGIEEGAAIPVEFTCDGENRLPVVGLTALPADTAELELIVDDPDAPTADPFVHWVVYGMPVTTREIDDDVVEFTYGTNDAGLTSWLGPCPPAGDGAHLYRWRLFALAEPLELEAGLDGRALEAAINAVIVGTAEFTASYQRAG